jgi:hypothetical protein
VYVQSPPEQAHVDEFCSQNSAAVPPTSRQSWTAIVSESVIVRSEITHSLTLTLSVFIINVRSPTVATELAKHNSDLLVVQEVKWDKGGTQPTDGYAFSMEM